MVLFLQKGLCMDKYKENNKLFSFYGVINRRNYIVNLLLVETIIQALVATPLFILALKSNNLAGTIIGGGSTPMWWNIALCVSSFLSIVMYMPSVTRRFRDIFGETQKDNVKTYSIFTFIILMLGIPAAFYPDLFLSFLKITGFAIIISLCCIKGSITGKYPKSEIAQFNWGAFIGTWIWGIFNRSYITLWALPLMFTMGALPFCILCGLKGNEWAYEKKIDKDVENFHYQQKMQAIIWSVILPILYCVLIVFASVKIYNFASKYINQHPDFAQKAIEYYVDTESKAALSIFDRIELTDNDYKFYINPKKWANSSYQQKVSYFDMANSYVILKDIDKNDIINTFSNISVEKTMNKIKIYSTFNNELLGEYYMDPQAFSELMHSVKSGQRNHKEVLKEIRKGYRFNSHPSLP